MKKMPMSLMSLVERQVKTWTADRSSGLSEETTGQIWPTITMSREFAARGAALSEAIAERTGFTVWDKEILQAVAEQAGANEKILASLDESRRTAINDAIQGIIMGSVYTNSTYLQTLMRVVHTLDVHGSNIIVGRGARYILKPESNLRVRVICPLQTRIKSYAERESIDVAKARQVVEKTDRDRAAFIRHHFKRSSGDPVHYDLIVNTGTFSENALVELVLSAYQAKFGRRPDRKTEAESAPGDPLVK